MDRTLYLECESGISGDMSVAMLLDLGADREVLAEALKSLPLQGYEIRISRVNRNGIDCCDFDVKLDAAHENHDHDMAYLHGLGDTSHDHDHHHDHDHDHDHDHGEGCTCGCHDHDHHHHDHDADEVFTSWGKETPHKYTKEKIESILKIFCDTEDYGSILRAKGMVPAEDGTWIYFDMVPGEYELRDGEPDYTGRLCVIGTNIDEHKLEELFELN